jgi:hypothetical protein
VAGRTSSRGGWFRNERGLKLRNGLNPVSQVTGPGSATMGETSVEGYHNNCVQTVSFRTPHFRAGRFEELSPLFAMCFAGQTLVHSKTLQMLFGTCADVFRMSAVKSTRGRS